MMRFAVDGWAPDYGPSVNGQTLDESTAVVDLTVECDPDAWSPIDPGATAPARTVLFVDGVQRIDARVWITDDGGTHQGACASWAAGVVRCNARAHVVAAEVRRGVLCPAADTEAIATRHGEYRPYPVSAGVRPGGPGATGGPSAAGDPVHEAMGRARGDLEGRVAAEARATTGGGGADKLLIVDGPLGDRRHIPDAVGYIKAHHVAYLPAAQQHVVAGLGPGQRTPLFAVGDRRFRYSWYLRLPGPATHPWWGIVRCEAAGDLARDQAVALANRVTATLPRFASQPYHDARAPQNLHPIAGLERELRRCLGDPILLDRALRQAAARA